MNEIKKLNVCIPARDRIILTEKCIESIWKNSDKFDKISIYVYDNKSDITEERMKLFYNLLNMNKIQYYSYDTEESTVNCFGKVIVFNRWLDMMKMEKELYDSIFELHRNKTQNYYLLIDNDFIVGPKWSENFISVCNQVKKTEPNVKFIVQWPGGIPSRGHGGPEWKIKNEFDENEMIKVKTANTGGSSGFWFGDYDMFQFLRWDINSLIRVFKINKRHDTETWNLIRRKQNITNYVCGIFSPEGYPFVLHLGGKTGSVCNELKRRSYDENKEIIKLAELPLKDMSVNEIYEKYKDNSGRW